MDWQPIDTAPKDRKILMYIPDKEICIGQWDKDAYRKKPHPYWRSYERESLRGVIAMRENQPTHWMPLPEPPKEDAHE